MLVVKTELRISKKKICIFNEKQHLKNKTKPNQQVSFRAVYINERPNK